MGVSSVSVAQAPSDMQETSLTSETLSRLITRETGWNEGREPASGRAERGWLGRSARAVLNAP